MVARTGSPRNYDTGLSFPGAAGNQKSGEGGSSLFLPAALWLIPWLATQLYHLSSVIPPPASTPEPPDSGKEIAVTGPHQTVQGGRLLQRALDVEVLAASLC